MFAKPQNVTISSNVQHFSGALLHVVIAMRWLLAQALEIPWGKFQHQGWLSFFRCFWDWILQACKTQNCGRHSRCIVFIAISISQSASVFKCGEATVETAGNWPTVVEIAGSCWFVDAEVALALPRTSWLCDSNGSQHENHESITASQALWTKPWHSRVKGVTWSKLLINLRLFVALSLAAKPLGLWKRRLPTLPRNSFGFVF